MGQIRSSLVSWSHRNLPLSMFLEKDDFGIKAYTGSKEQNQSNETIIKQLGIGILSATGEDEEDEDEIPEYTYRANTVVYTSFTTKLGMDLVKQYGAEITDRNKVCPVGVNI